MGAISICSELTPLDIEILKALANNRMRVKTAARAIPATHVYMRYHIDRIRVKTGLNPLEFYDLVKLLDKVKEAENETDS